MLTKRKSLVWLVKLNSLFVLLFNYDVRVEAATNELRGRSVVMNWTELAHVHRERKPRKGNDFEKSEGGSARVYISEKGRIFGETEMRGEGGGRRHLAQGPVQRGPDDEQSDVGSQDTWHWFLSGDTISGTRLFNEGARRVNARIGRNGDQFTCELQVIMGKFEGHLLRTGGRRGAPEEVLSAEIQDPTCQVVDGNVFAQ